MNNRGIGKKENQSTLRYNVQLFTRCVRTSRGIQLFGSKRIKEIIDAIARAGHGIRQCVEK